MTPTGCWLRDRSRERPGYARALEAHGDGFATVQWPGEEVCRQRVGDGSDLVRADLHPGHPVRLGDTTGTVLARTGDPHTLWTYRVQLDEEVRDVTEDELEPVPGDDARGALASLGWGDTETLAARIALRRVQSRWFEDSYGIPAILGARVVPLPHQLHAVYRVLTDRTPRFVLADEVGLGKTIEAGLVLQALRATHPTLRVAVVAPGAMTRQWLCELFLRFGEQVFVHVDALRLERPDGLPALDTPRLIVSTAALESSAAARARLLELPWDVLVLDEAHQLTPDSSLYACVRTLAQRAWGVLALSATPAKGDLRGLLGLLGIVAPEVYDPADPARFEAVFAAREAIAERLEASLTALPNADPRQRRALAKGWAQTLPDDPQVAAAVKAEQRGDPEALEALLAYVQEFHRIDRRWVRTRRATVQALGTALCQRSLETKRYRASATERRLVEWLDTPPGAPDGPAQRILHGIYRRACASTPVATLELLEQRRSALEGKRSDAADFDPEAALSADPGPAEEAYVLRRVVEEAPELEGEGPWLHEAVQRTHAWMVDARDGCARVRAVREVLQELGRKQGLVFAQDRALVEDLAESLQDTWGPDAVGVIHHGLDEATVAEAALRFQSGESRVLVSDELGGEGRNFHMAEAVVHVDLPWGAGRVEQRVGRLDRIGRDPRRAVRSVTIVGPSATERALWAVHAEALEVFTRSLGGLEFALPEFQRETARAACAGAKALTTWAPELKARAEAERGGGERGRALDASTDAWEEACERAEVAADVDGESDLDTLSRWSRRIGIDWEEQAEGVVRAQWTWEHLRRVPPGWVERVPEEGRVRKWGTFRRAVALKNESLEFFAPGHPLVDAVVRDLDHSQEGRAAVWTRELGPEHRGHLYLLVVGRTTLDTEDLPEGLRHRARAYLWPQVRAEVVRLKPGRTPGAVHVDDRVLRDCLERTDASDRTLDPDVLARSVPTAALWEAVDEGIEVARAAIAARRRPEVAEAQERLGEALSRDRAFLQSVGDAEREAELAARAALEAAVGGERVEVEALGLVIGR